MKSSGKSTRYFFMGVDMTTRNDVLIAAERSIGKWVDIEKGDGEDNGADDCGYCRLFHPDHNAGKREMTCYPCPITLDTGFSWCNGTPHDKWMNLKRMLNIKISVLAWDFPLTVEMALKSASLRDKEKLVKKYVPEEHQEELIDMIVDMYRIAGKEVEFLRDIKAGLITGTIQPPEDTGWENEDNR